MSAGTGEGAALPAVVLKPRSLFHRAGRLILFKKSVLCSEAPVTSTEQSKPEVLSVPLWCV